MDWSHIFQNFVVLQKSRKTWQEILSRRIPWLDRFYATPLNNILKMAEQCCATIVMEQDYVDVDYLDTYCNYYSTVFADYPSKCYRLHLFSKRLYSKDLIDLSSYQQFYLGFCILRPTLSFQLSRSVLKPFFDDGVSSFTLCKSLFEVNLAGNRLMI